MIMIIYIAIKYVIHNWSTIANKSQAEWALYSALFLSNYALFMFIMIKLDIRDYLYLKPCIEHIFHVFCSFSNKDKII